MSFKFEALPYVSAGTYIEQMPTWKVSPGRQLSCWHGVHLLNEHLQSATVYLSQVKLGEHNSKRLVLPSGVYNPIGETGNYKAVG